MTRSRYRFRFNTKMLVLLIVNSPAPPIPRWMAANRAMMTLHAKGCHKDQAASARSQSNASIRNARWGGNRRLIHESYCSFQAVRIFPVDTWMTSINGV